MPATSIIADKLDALCHRLDSFEENDRRLNRDRVENLIDAAFVESDHPRGQPDNAGQFASSSGGGKKGAEISKKPAEKRVDSATTLFEHYTDHKLTVEKIIASLPKETKAKIAEVKTKLAASVPTDAPTNQGGHKLPNGTYTPARERLHRRIISELLSPEIVKRAKPGAGEKPVFTILGGRGGSGKSWFTGKDGPVRGDKSVVLDNDHIKSRLPEYEGWNAALVHEEAAHIFNLVDSTARRMGLNIVHDATMKTAKSSEAFVEAYRKAGYEVHGYYMFLPPEEATKRAIARFEGPKGRFVPPEYVMSSRENEKNFDALRSKFAKWAVYNNNVPRGEGPRHVASGGD
jgi:predicted ABC-type ATPase